MRGFILSLILLLASCSNISKIKHYIYFARERESLQNEEALKSSKIEGAQIVYTWRELEREKDHYDFSIIEEDFDYLKSIGKKLFIQIQANSFSKERKNVPDYILEDEKYAGGATLQYRFENEEDEGAKRLGWVAKLWNKRVNERFQNLILNLGEKFDGEVEGVNLSETSIDLGETGIYFPKDFSHSSYLEALLDNMQVLKRAFSLSKAVVYINFIPGEWLPYNEKGYMRTIFTQAENLKLGVGGPDLLPYKKTHMNNSYPFVKDYPKSLIKVMAVQDGNYSYINPQSGEQITIAEILDFAENYLDLNYIFWAREFPYFENLTSSL